jgi:3-oxoacyl-[acyl-carrier protein] reductase
MQDELTGKTALVTGGARGLGRKYALELADQGADVAIADIDLSSYREYEQEKEGMEADSVEAEIEARGVDSLGITADVTDREQVADMIEEVVETFGSLDVLVTNAGGGTGELNETFASELEGEHLHATVERNFYGTVYTCVAAAPTMKDQGSGSVITVASQAGRRAHDDGSYAHYGAAKAAVIMYTKYLAQDLGRYGVRANVIAPGYIGTGRLQESFERLGVEEIEADTALGRIGDPEECAELVSFLASEKSRYITGALLPVDGGTIRS